MRYRIAGLAMLVLSMASHSACDAAVMCTPGSPFPEILSIFDIAAFASELADKPPRPAAIYCYDDYQAAVQASDAAGAAAMAMDDVIDFHDSTDRWPRSSEEAKYVQLPSKSKFGQQPVDISEGGKITVHFSDYMTQLRGKSMVYTPVVGSDGKVRFKCEAPGLAAMYRRAWCP
jgi:hypothetical protein